MPEVGKEDARVLGYDARGKRAPRELQAPLRRIHVMARRTNSD